jgi:hypothetical protein
VNPCMTMRCAANTRCNPATATCDPIADTSLPLPPVVSNPEAESMKSNRAE